MTIIKQEKEKRTMTKENNENKKTAYQYEVKKAFEKIEIGVRSVFESENYKRYLETMSRFYKYSINNSILIMLQAPSATAIAGASKWRNEFGRTIKKGAKAIKILIPHPYKREIEVEQEDGTMKTEIKELCYFTLGNVFDLDQTETEGEDNFPRICRELQEDSEEIKKAISICEKVSECPVSYWNLKDSSKGFYSKKDNKIVVKKGMTTSQTLKTLVHEIVHSRLHNTDNDIPRNVKEVQAESISFVVCSALFGVDTSDYSFEYIANWNGKDTKELKSILSNIQKQANNLIQDIQKEMEREVA